MYPKIRVDKLHPDGSLRAVVEGYRIEDHDGAIRVWVPPRSPLVHVNGRWVSESPRITAWEPNTPFVVSYFADAGGHGLYIDIVREVTVTPDRFAYVDLYVDVLLYGGKVTTKDEELLSRLSRDEAAFVLMTRDVLVRAVRANVPTFDLRSARWTISDEVRALPPGDELALTSLR